MTDIFTKTGSSLSAKNSSLLVSITQIIANLVLLNIIERINRRVLINMDILRCINQLRRIYFLLQTLYIVSSILTAISFFFFGAYCLLWQDRPEYKWMPPLFFACIIFFSCMGLLPIPYILTTEIFPKKVNKIIKQIK